ncbi:MAG: PQQ-dependent sugar dehydrogenase [Synechococcaceae cyanobacterium SM2_3_2]|nr:PQQ-dependent sugar dehydrogenase [Synechococcaceae cyanobacterium SM2_3_2]
MTGEPGLSSAPAVQDLPAPTNSVAFELVTVTTGLANPWGLAFLPDASMLVTERLGHLRRISPTGELDPTPVAGVPEVVAQGQGGLLDVIVDPEFEQNQVIYLSYAAAGSGGAGTRVARAQLTDQGLENLTILLDMDRKTNAGVHFGSRLTFGADGFLYVGTGDRGDRDRAQDLNDFAGKVLRVDPTGAIPADNPFASQPEVASQPEAAAAVYSWGHRNIQGLATHPDTGEVWAHEHGPRGGDEINRIAPSLNYGWPLITYGREYSGSQVGQGISAQAGLEQPVVHWTPSVAPSGMTFYTGDAFPDWRGDLFVGALAGQHLARLQMEGERVIGHERLLDQQVGRIRDVRTGPDGFLYLLTDDPNGSLLRLEPL